MASAVYVLQVGTNRHAPVSHGESKYLYARISPRATRAATPRFCGCTRDSGGAFQEGVEFTLETGERCIQCFAAWDNDDIEACGWFALSEQLSNQTLRAITGDGAADSSRRRDAESWTVVGIWPDEQRHISPAHLGAALVRVLEIGAPANVLGRPERCGGGPLLH